MHQTRGFTVVELAVSLLLFVFVLGALYSFFFTGSRLGRREAEAMGLRSDALRSLTWFSKDLQQGMSVILPKPGNTLGHAVIQGKTNELIAYSLVSDTGRSPFVLRRVLATPGGSERSDVLVGVNAVRFTALSEGALRVHLTLEGETKQFAFLTQLRLRNREGLESW